MSLFDLIQRNKQHLDQEENETRSHQDERFQEFVSNTEQNKRNAADRSFAYRDDQMKEAIDYEEAEAEDTARFQADEYKNTANINSATERYEILKQQIVGRNPQLAPFVNELESRCQQAETNALRRILGL